MGGWVDGWVDEWVGGWMDGWVDGWMDGWMGEWVDGWVGGKPRCLTLLAMTNAWLGPLWPEGSLSLHLRLPLREWLSAQCSCHVFRVPALFCAYFTSNAWVNHLLGRPS
jgi:hypothetical protein